MSKKVMVNEREQSCLTCTAFSPGCEDGCTFDIPEADEVMTKASILAKRKRMKAERAHATAKAEKKVMSACKKEPGNSAYAKEERQRNIISAAKELEKQQKRDERRHAKVKK